MSNKAFEWTAAHQARFDEYIEAQEASWSKYCDEMNELEAVRRVRLAIGEEAVDTAIDRALEGKSSPEEAKVQLKRAFGLWNEAYEDAERIFIADRIQVRNWENDRKRNIENEYLPIRVKEEEK